ncbi:MAG: DUF86 domain-containing protein [Planctomycetaceae bacterium]|nr:DUF86 domain-containing protein [Planctomycetaceae bacterium]
MSKKTDWEVIEGKLINVQGALATVEKRFREVPNADFFRSAEGEERRDGICMLYQAIGETFKQIDEKTNKDFLSRYPEIIWKDVIGFRNIIAHDYFSIDEEVLFAICQTHLPLLQETVNRMIDDLEKRTDLRNFIEPHS